MEQIHAVERATSKVPSPVGSHKSKRQNPMTKPDPLLSKHFLNSDSQLGVQVWPSPNWRYLPSQRSTSCGRRCIHQPESARVAFIFHLFPLSKLDTHLDFYLKFKLILTSWLTTASPRGSCQHLLKFLHLRLEVGRRFQLGDLQKAAEVLDHLPRGFHVVGSDGHQPCLPQCFLLNL